MKVNYWMQYYDVDVITNPRWRSAANIMKIVMSASGVAGRGGPGVRTPPEPPGIVHVNRANPMRKYFGKGVGGGGLYPICWMCLSYLFGNANRPACHVHCRCLSTLSTAVSVLLQQTPTTLTVCRDGTFPGVINRPSGPWSGCEREMRYLHLQQCRYGLAGCCLCLGLLSLSVCLAFSSLLLMCTLYPRCGLVESLYAKLPTTVAVFNCWRPSFRCGWCSTMEQSATWHRGEWHTVTFPSWTQNIFI